MPAKARDDECKTGYATKCRAREDDLAKANAALIEAQQNRAATKLVEEIDADLAAANSALAKLGSIPAHADQTAALFASVAQVWFPSSAADAISDNRAAFMGFISEFLASLMPWALYKGFGPGRASLVPHAKTLTLIDGKDRHPALVEAFKAQHIADKPGAPGLKPAELFAPWKEFCAERRVDLGLAESLQQ